MSLFVRCAFEYQAVEYDKINDKRYCQSCWFNIPYKEKYETNKKLVDELNEELTNKWGEYVRLHEELHSHKGKPISETDLPEVNRLLKDIQEMLLRYIQLTLHSYS